MSVLRTVLIVFSAFLFTQNLIAQEVETPFRVGSELYTVAAHITVISGEELEKASSVIEALKGIPGVQVRSYADNGVNTIVDLGGFGETGNLNVVLLVDGIPQNTPDLAGIIWTDLPPVSSIERIEILKGQGGVLYGDHTTGGVVNVITKNRTGLSSSALSIIPRVEIQSFGYKRGEVTVSKQFDEFFFGLTHSERKQDGYRENGGDRGQDTQLNLGMGNPNKGFSVSLKLGRNDDEYGLPGTLSQEDLDAGRSPRETNEPENRATRNSTQATLVTTYSFNSNQQIKVNVSVKERDSFLHYDWGSGFVTDFDYSDKTQSVSPQYHIVQRVLGLENSITIGADFLNTDRSVQENGTLEPMDFSRKEKGTFVSNSIQVMPNVFLNLGLRRSQVRYNFKDETVQHDLSAGNVGVAFRFKPQSRLYLAYDRSFRTPVSDELTTVEFNPETYEVSTSINQSLKPQITKTLQLGLQHQISRELSAGVMIFQIKNENELFFDPINGFSNRNRDNTTRQGITIEAAARILNERLNLWGNTTLMRARLGADASDPFEGNQIPGATLRSANAGMNLQATKSLLLSAVTHWRGKYTSFSDWGNTLPEAPNYLVVDLGTTWKARNWLIMRGGIDNLFNRRNTDFTFYGNQQYPSTGRRFRLQFETPVHRH